MKQIFNPAVTAEVGEQLRETVSPFQAPPKSRAKPKSDARRVVNGFEIRSDIPLERTKNRGIIGKWGKLFAALKVGECAIFSDKKTVKTFQVWGINNKKRIVYRKLENGKFAAFKLRAPKSKGGK